MSPLKICFLQVTSTEIHEYSQYSCPINKEYCRKHGYDYLNLDAINLKEYAASWSKIIHSIDILTSKQYDYIFYLDADAAVINQTIKIESIIADMKGDISFSENGWNGGELINAGSFIVSKNGIDILKEMIKLVNNQEMLSKKYQFPWEQSIINKIYSEGNFKIDVFPMNKINSYWLYDINSNDGQFIYHFMARSLKEKVVIAKALYEKYIKNI